MHGAFSSVSAFLLMGGYADYVWSAYTIALIVLVVNSVIALRQFRKIKKQLRIKHELAT